MVETHICRNLPLTGKEKLAKNALGALTKNNRSPIFIPIVSYVSIFASARAFISGPPGIYIDKNL